MKKHLLVLAFSFCQYAYAASAPQAVLSFAEPADGATVTSPFKVRFVVAGMAVKPAGDMTVGTGHHHLLINTGPIKEGESVPFDDAHQHFGKGQSETDLKLPPGKYKLTLQFANGAHQSYGPAASKTITVNVK